MEGGDGEGGVVDASVGTIVWVRRRNGSWWPGRILGQEELAASHLMSPRSGTPVKLLGREDASVDWYNLEKSKRVKAFRCGEFNACIERAEAAQGVPIKKREKYARREDAILHALELERKQLETKRQEQGLPSDSNPNLPSTVITNNTTISYPGITSSSKFSGPSHRYKSKKKRSLPAPWDEFGDEFEDSLHRESDGFTSHKKKTAEESLVKKKDRRKPLTQVLQSSTKLLPPAVSQLYDSGAVILTGGEVKGEPMGAVYRGKRSQCMYLNPDSDDSVNPGALIPVGGQVSTADSAIENFIQEPVPLGEEEFESYGLVQHPKLEPEPEIELEPEPEPEPELEPELEPEPDPELEPKCESSEGCSSEETDTDTDGEPEFLQATSQTVKPESELVRDPSSVTYIDMEYMDRKPISFCIPRLEHQDEPGVSQWHMKGKRNHRSSSSKCNGGGGSINSSARDGPTCQPNKDESSAGQAFDFDPYGYDYYENNAPPMLIDVDLKVQASYQGERVPLVSLMSRLNGKAIVGHPVPIEPLEFGSSSRFLPSQDSYGVVPAPSWRTGRRTAMQRVPRTNPGCRTTFPKKTGTGTKSSHVRKSNKKKKSSASQKTKTKMLSSIGGGILGGLIKPEGGVPLVTCVPVKVVFSRILEAVGRPSLSFAHRVRMSSPAIRDQQPL